MAAAAAQAGRALISVSDKAGLAELAKGLADLGYEIVSTGGSAAAIEAMGVPCKKVEEVTGFPEMLDGEERRRRASQGGGGWRSQRPRHRGLVFLSRSLARSLTPHASLLPQPTTPKTTTKPPNTGRVKTLHPGVHGGILAVRSDPKHTAAIKQHGIAPIDVVAVNLYPFRATVTRTPAPDFATGVENIDIGGPAMIRAAAKNHADVAVVVDPADYAPLLEQLAAEQKNAREGARSAAGAALRKRLAWKAYQHTASYDAQVSEWLWAQGAGGGGEDGAPGAPPPALTVPLRLALPLRYGENPHQRAAFYADESLAEAGLRSGVGHSVQHHGKEMSYNNYLDADAAFTTVSDFSVPACVVVKHTNPCGVATAHADDPSSLLEAYRSAVRADPVSAFGGIVAFNREVDADMAREIREFRSPTDGETRMFYEIVIAPGYSSEGLEILKGKSKALRILEAPLRPPTGRQLRQVSGGWLWQGPDDLAPADAAGGAKKEGGKKEGEAVPTAVEFTVVSEAQPTKEMLEDLATAWRCVKHVKSNAIAVAKAGRMLGMGSGQPNRVKSTQIALEKAGSEARGAALASDAFFPFSWGDSVEIACQAGVAAIAHPGGSIRDEDAIACCNKYGVVLVTTGVRHFKH
jgi:phosphoribosylaminoimidazolecarboxamide formyltransferase / IMP cyclohydrolase